ncbi:MAG: type I 3-dehydroquinate dehydratase, partial [Methanomassiliicoccales archaeon]|nr:type I 3-dehydroquinate dehydratase [Methanomassiliicoccales archaeon]
MMKICISIVEKTLEEALAASKRAAEKSPDLIEVRFDHITPLPDDLTGFKDIAVPKIATVRSVSQGGKFAGSDREKSALLRRAIKAGFKVIDLESDSPLLTHSVRDFRGADIVCSHHDLQLTPETARI